MSDVKHWDWHCDVGCMVEAPDGCWVDSDDYDALAAECQKLRKRARTAEREAAQALRTLKGLEKVAKVVDANSDEVCGENNALRADNKRLREALADLLDCPAHVVQATVPRAGIDAAPPYQVVLDVSVSLTRWNNAKAALAGSKEGYL